jgi:hypothetical protein
VERLAPAAVDQEQVEPEPEFLSRTTYDRILTHASRRATMTVARATLARQRERVITDRFVRLAGLYAVAAAVASFAVTPLLAVAYFATDDGAEALETGSVSAWGRASARRLGPLLTFASDEAVYLTYLKLFGLLAPALVLCAVAAKSRRPVPAGRSEGWGWRLGLVGYTMLALGVLLALPGVGEIVFAALVVPGLVFSTIGSTVLGVALIRASFRPRLTPWPLTLSLPLWLVGSDVLGHNSLGVVPLFVAWGVTGWRLWRSEVPALDGADVAAAH